MSDNTNMGYDEVSSYDSANPIWVYGVFNGTEDVRFDVSNLINLLDARKREKFSIENKAEAFTAEFYKTYRCSGTFTVTLPQSNNMGKYIMFVNIGTGVITLNAGTDTINGQSGWTSHDLVPGDSVTFEGTNTTDWSVY